MGTGTVRQRVSKLVFVVSLGRGMNQADMSVRTRARRLGAAALLSTQAETIRSTEAAGTAPRNV